MKDKLDRLHSSIIYPYSWTELINYLGTLMWWKRGKKPSGFQFPSIYRRPQTKGILSRHLLVVLSPSSYGFSQLHFKVSSERKRYPFYSTLMWSQVSAMVRGPCSLTTSKMVRVMVCVSSGGVGGSMGFIFGFGFLAIHRIAVANMSLRHSAST